MPGTVAQLGVGWVGSPADLATLIVILAVYFKDVRARLDTAASGLVALARNDSGVDDEQLQADLEVSDSDVEALEQELRTMQEDD